MSLSHVVLTSGRSVELTEIRMESTYAGMLEGYPCKPINDMKTRGLRRRAEQSFPTLPVHLVPPVLAHPDQTGGAFGPVEVLPSVLCIGVFRSTAVDPGLDPVLHRSALVVAWFQDTAVVPSGEDADPALRGIDWDALAEDGEL
ncbi:MULTISPECIES: hypothetical protein [Streptomyces]|uniref:hypothetical protein n=1 Tax=Streptomyces TaxID=1883 RepID=UPI000BF0626A|nr:hypothetical protein [Streptomyces sp. ms184]